MPRQSTSGRAAQPAPPAPDDPVADPGERFYAALAPGDFDALLGRSLRRALRQAAADPGLDLEVGALRLTLIRLLDAESDPHRLAADIARVARVALQAAALRPAPDTESDKIRSHLEREFAILDREMEEAARREPPRALDFLPV
jgi:hypothetical protein